jgi:hypothetical protein
MSTNSESPDEQLVRRRLAQLQPEEDAGCSWLFASAILAVVNLVVTVVLASSPWGNVGLPRALGTLALAIILCISTLAGAILAPIGLSPPAVWCCCLCLGCAFRYGGYSFPSWFLG